MADLLDLHAFVARGPNKGAILFPHKHRDGSYVVSMTRYERDYIRVSKPSEVLSWLEKGYRLRMSNTMEGISSPSLIEPSQIYRPVAL